VSYFYIVSREEENRSKPCDTRSLEHAPKRIFKSWGNFWKSTPKPPQNSH